MHRRMLVLGGLVVLVVLTAGLRLLVGSGSLGDPELAPVLLRMRGVQAGIAALAGAALAVAGALVQALFRNPLADPGVLGIGAAAMLGGQLALLAGAASGLLASATFASELLVPLGSLAGGLAALLALLGVHRRLGEGLGVLLAGVVLGMACGAASSLLVAWSQGDWQLARALLGLGMGDISGKGALQLWLATPLVLAGLFAACGQARGCDLLLSGDDEARALGLETARLRCWLVLWCALLVAAAVAIGGVLPFVGLIVPHLLRPLLGVSHRTLLPAAALGGAALAVSADVLAQVLHPRGVLPLGAVCAALGAPVFIALLLRRGAGAWR